MEITGMVPLLNVEDAERSIAFYRDVLAFEVADRMEVAGRVRWAHIARGPVHFMLNQRDGANSSARRALPSYRDAMFFFEVPDARKTRAGLAARGFDVDEPRHEAYGWEFHLRDPDGYELGFTDTKRPG